METIIHRQDHNNKKRNSARVNLTIAVVLHVVVFLAAAWWAARSGILGKDLQALALTMVEKEKPKQPDVKKDDLAKQQEQVNKELENIRKEVATAPSAAPPPPAALPSDIVAPPPVEASTINFGEVDENPNGTYSGKIEQALRANWVRPEGIDDLKYVAEIEVSIDKKGAITGYKWLSGSNDPRWDESVKKAMASIKSLGSAPPPQFPPNFMVRFDVQDTALMSKAD